ncbi:KRAB-A domain-containing protein 2-like [Aphis craccivora]|uniref:KRAB-A domain-containing protein 2-like n=1 Tax=Aphis craccivora TaxID=307492 RepID=A0A6G0YYE3_APHCR|nr:KRAB-A domain-containing protein 2-like [Aphis craccivora]
MKQTSENRFSQGKIDESVAIKIADIDKAHSDLRNIIGVILSVNNIICTKFEHQKAFFPIHIAVTN